MRLSYRTVQFTRDDQPVVVAGLDAYRLLDHFIHGRNIEPFLDQFTGAVAAARVSAPWLLPVLRVFTMAYQDPEGHGIMTLRPSDYSYDSVRALADFAYDRWGFTILWNVLADNEYLGLSDVACHQHAQHMAAALSGVRADFSLYALVNEADHLGTRIDPGRYPEPPAVLSSRGSMSSGVHPYRPGWKFNLLHAERGGVRGSLSAGTAAYAVQGYPGNPGDPGDREHPTLVEETEGAADQPKPGSRRSNPDYFYRTGFLSAAFGAGGFFHSDCGIQAIPFTAQQQACAEAYFVGMSKADPAQIYRGE